jgi:hypothetical protein
MEGSGPGFGAVQIITDTDPDPGGTKKYGSGSGTPAKNIAYQQKILSPGVCCLWPVSVLDLHVFLKQRRL